MGLPANVPSRALGLHHTSLTRQLRSQRLFSTSSLCRAAAATLEPTDKKAYSHTLRLPKTSVPLKNKDPVSVEQQLRRRICDELYTWQAEHNTGAPFVFLDGPPYANGNLHMGHALNKVLKDFINRYQVLRGRRVRFEPGWDCHGLPIEQKALAVIGQSHTSLDPVRIRQIARETATNAIAVQKKELRDLGVMADWDNHSATYRTLDHDFETRQLKMLQAMIEKGHVFHRLRPTFYSPAARTALAEAELQYVDNHVSRSVYVTFNVTPEDMSAPLIEAWRQSTNAPELRDLNLAVWTTTPWTLPSNLAVAVHNDMIYSVCEMSDGRLLVVQDDRLEQMREIAGELRVIFNVSGADLVGTRYTHYFRPPTSTLTKPSVVHASHVSNESGTGLVHMAPVHGHEDYHAFMETGMLPDDLQCPVDDDGKFSEVLLSVIGVESEDFSSLIGQDVLGGGARSVIALLRESGTLLAEKKIKHRYPYDWKTNTPVIIRATPQWFADVGGIKPRALEAMKQTTFTPPSALTTQGLKRLEAFVNSRSEWCISRQRSWGVPIPILFDADDKPITRSEFLERAIQVLDDKGTDHWWTGAIEDFIPPASSNDPAFSSVRKGNDTLDVWFDSGSAWTSLVKAHGKSDDRPLANVILEGSDQHRGWFQSTLLTRLITSPTSTPVSQNIVTHGFIVDEAGKKMSKSDGNGVSPMDVIHGSKKTPARGADVLRVWAASVDFSRDVSFGPTAIAQAAEQLRKLRSVLRFMLGNVSDVEVDSTRPVQRDLLDRYMMHQVATLEGAVQSAYDEFAFSKALQAVNNFTVTTLSTVYFDAIKDTLYCDDVASDRRIAVTFTLHEILQRLLKVVAPIVPHLAEEINQASSRPIVPSIFAQVWTLQSTGWVDERVDNDTSRLLHLRQEALSLLETCRAENLFKQPSEVDLYLNVPAEGEAYFLLKDNADLLPRLFTSSTVDIGGPPQNPEWSREHVAQLGDEKVVMTVAPSRSHQCPRCWNYHSTKQGELCRRCSSCLSSSPAPRS